MTIAVDLGRKATKQTNKQTDCTDVQADLSLGWVHIPHYTFCFVPAQWLTYQKSNLVVGEVLNFVCLNLR